MVAFVSVANEKPMEPTPSSESLQLVFVYGTLKRGQHKPLSAQPQQQPTIECTI